MRPCVEKCRVFLIGKKLWLHITKALYLSHFSWIKVNYPIRNIWDNYRKKYWKKKKVKIGVKSKKMVGGYLRKTRGIGYEWSYRMSKSRLNRRLFWCSKRLWKHFENIFSIFVFVKTKKSEKFDDLSPFLAWFWWNLT